MPWAAAAAAAAAIGGAVISSNASEDAANTQAAATNRGIAATGRQQDLTRADSAPFRAAGVSAMDQLRQLLGIAPGSQGPVTQSYAGSLVDSSGGHPAPNQELYATDAGYRKAWDEFDQAHRDWHHTGFTSESDPSVIEREVRARLPNASSAPTNGQPGQPGSGPTTLASPLNRSFSVDDFWKDPVVQLGYQSGLDLGTKALKNAAPLTTGLDSGAALKELTKFGTDYTGQQAAGSQARFEGNKTNIYNRLMGLVNGGQTANALDASAGSAAATNNANLISAQGNASAAGRIAQGNAYSGGVSSIANWWQQKNMMDQMTNSGAGNGYFGGSGSYNQNQATYNSSMYGY